MEGQERREFLRTFFGAVGVGALGGCAATAPLAEKDVPYAQPSLMPSELRQLDRVGGALKITKVETFLVKPRWQFLKIHTDAGIVGLGEPITEGRALTVKAAVEEVAPYLIGKDPRRVVHHWQAIYRHAFYRGGPILTSALSGIDQALWDIKGKALGVPIYELLGGPTRDRVRVYAHAGKPDLLKQKKAQGFTAFKCGPSKIRPARFIETPAFVSKVAEGRRLEWAQVDSVARGRVWMGEDAVRHRLVDEIGGLEAAITEARRRANVPPGEKIAPVEYHRPRGGLLERLIGSALQTAWMKTFGAAAALEGPAYLADDWVVE